MELVAGTAIATAATWKGYQVLRNRIKTRVNCWFCNGDFRVNYADRNSFVCPGCDQYNGFKTDGDYNKRIPAQSVASSPTSSKFCATLKNAEKPENGLCTDCNIKQGIIVEKTRHFEPIDEDRWDEEFEEFKYKLNKLFPLCGPCTLFCHAKLEDDKKNYSYLLQIKERMVALHQAAFETLPKKIQRFKRKRHFFAGGNCTEICHFSTLFLTMCLFIAHLHSLQEDAEINLITFPSLLMRPLNFLYPLTFHLVILSLALHLLGMMYNLARVTLPDLIYPLINSLMMVSFSTSSEEYAQDILLCRCAFTAFLSVLSFAVTLVPRKLLRKNRSNPIFASALSIASSPTSECSTRNNSLLLDTSSQVENDYQSRVAITKPMQYREREQSVEPISAFKRFKRPAEAEDMDWEPSVVNGPRSTFLKESTPARELAPSLSSMSLSAQNRRPQKIFSTFSTTDGALPSFAHDVFSPTYRRSVAGSSFRNANRAASVFSQMTSVSRRLPVIDGSPKTDPSVFTSISQRDSGVGRGWLIIGCIMAISSLLGNIAFFYFVFRK